MISSKTISFSKSSNCPSSQELLEFQNGGAPVKNIKKIGNHVRRCEFCTVELEFYARFPQTEDLPVPDEPTDIPRPLFELAEALLSKKHLDFLSLNKIFPDSERLKV